MVNIYFKIYSKICTQPPHELKQSSASYQKQLFIREIYVLSNKDSTSFITNNLLKNV